MKQARKIKKNNKVVDEPKKIKKVVAEESSYALKLIYIIVGVVLAIGILYLITYFVKKDNSSEEATKFNNEIIVGQIWTRSEEKYIVLLGNEDDSSFSTNSDEIKGYADTLKYGFYTVDTKALFNKSYVSETSNLNEKGGAFRVSGMTVLVIENGNVVSTYEGAENISNYIYELSNDAALAKDSAEKE